MSETEIISKVMVHDNNAEAESVLRLFFKHHNLIALKSSPDSFMQIMSNQTDLGAVFISEDSEANGFKGKDLGMYIHRIRPELPVFLRTSESSLLEEPYLSCLAGNYSLNNLDDLLKLVEDHIFTNYYPMPLVRGIQNISEDALNAVVKGLEITVDRPYLVNDQIIYGELFSLIPLESVWCRGTMMLQTTQQDILNIIDLGMTHLNVASPNFREVNEILNEVTNLIWGKMKSDFFSGSEKLENTATRVQVPIMVNHKEKYISFGTRDPQLCFRYTLRSPAQPDKSFVLYQKLIFNLSWDPDLFSEANQSTDELVSSGELEFF